MTYDFKPYLRRDVTYPNLPLESLSNEPTNSRTGQIVCSCSFRRKLTDYRELSAALAEFGSRAAEKLRKQDSVTGCITVFIRTNLFNTNEPQCQRAASTKMKISLEVRF